VGEGYSYKHTEEEIRQFSILLKDQMVPVITIRYLLPLLTFSSNERRINQRGGRRREEIEKKRTGRA